jgi:hypothetical protein
MNTVRYIQVDHLPFPDLLTVLFGSGLKARAWVGSGRVGLGLAGNFISAMIM